MKTEGRDFTQKYDNQVTEMKRLFLDFMKAQRVRADENAQVQLGSGPDAANRLDSASGRGIKSDHIDLSPAGYPIIPESINENLSKAVCEKLLRGFLTQHYCR